MDSIGVDFHKAYSHMTVMDAQGQVVRAGKVPNTVEAVQAFVAPYRENAQAVVEAHAELDRDVRHAGTGTPRRLLGPPAEGPTDCGSADQNGSDRLEDSGAPLAL